MLKILIVLTLALTIMIVGFSAPLAAPIEPQKINAFSEEELAVYDGTDSNLPVFIAVDGYVYNVTGDREIYAPGGMYHHLTGSNQHTELDMPGIENVNGKHPVWV